MKTKIYFLSILLVVMVIASCQKEPIAMISADKTSAEVTETVKFTNTTIDADSYDWDFGDGQTSSEKSPSHSWNSAGLYSCKMTAFSKNGKKSDDESISIKVNDINAKFLGTYSVSDNYSSDYCGNGTYSYTMTINAGSSGTKVIINNLTGSFNNINGNISGTTINIPTQYGIEVIGDGSYWDIYNSSGSLSGTTLTMTYIISDSAYDDICGLMNLSLTAIKQ